ncbi:hypothetical protein C8T65DRAFT_666856 [Cerioporus squamosus]|nr:hypothetical protein C8T65DRAFT_666856 [Cerioporus squamosus]
MPQAWYLINVDKKQMSNWHGLYDSSNFFGTLGSDEQPCRSIFPPRLPRQMDVWCNSDAMVIQSSALFVLPPELLDAIFSALIELQHTVSFAVTCRYLLSVGRSRILGALREFYSPWAGCRLICIGSKTKEGDLPANLLTSQEREEMREWSLRGDTTKDDEDTDGSGSEDDEPMGKGFLGYIYSRYRLALSRVWTLHRSDGALLLLDAMKRGEADRNQPGHPHPTFESDCRLFSTVFGLQLDPMPPRSHVPLWAPQYPTGTRVLCNLSRAEYIREDRMTLAWGPRRGVAWVHVLLSLISWSSDPETGLPMSKEHAKNFHRGRWAGNRICMAVLEQLPDTGHRAGAGRDGKDVSEDTDKLLRDIWDRKDPSLLTNDRPLLYTEWEIRGDRMQK